MSNVKWKKKKVFVQLLIMPLISIESSAQPQDVNAFLKAVSSESSVMLNKPEKVG